MAASAKHKKYREDDFDLDYYIESQERRAGFKAFRERNQKLINVLTVFIIVLAFVIAWLGYTVISYYIELWQNRQLNYKGREIMTDASSGEVKADDGLYGTLTSASDSRASGFVPIDPPDQNISRQRITALQKEFDNEEIAGYLYIPDTNVDFPVVLGADNDFYLSHSLSKEENVAGAAFMDYDNRLDPLDYNTIIYAHNMRNGSMFHDLKNYGDKAYFDQHKIIRLETIYENTKWEIFSFYITTTDFNYIQINFPSDEEFYAKLAQVVKKKSAYDTGVEVTPDDRILTLSTCTNRVDDSRYVVHAKRIK